MSFLKKQHTTSGRGLAILLHQFGKDEKKDKEMVLSKLPYTLLGAGKAVWSLLVKPEVVPLLKMVRVSFHDIVSV